MQTIAQTFPQAVTSTTYIRWFDTLTNADVAVALLEAHPDIRLIFTDIDMPGSMDGLKLAAAVRDRWPPIGIIITSGRHVVNDADMPEGTRFFGKPYDHTTITRSMREMLRQ